MHHVYTHSPPFLYPSHPHQYYNYFLVTFSSVASVKYKDTALSEFPNIWRMTC